MAGDGTGGDVDDPGHDGGRDQGAYRPAGRGLEGSVLQGRQRSSGAASLYRVLRAVAEADRDLDRHLDEAGSGRVDPRESSAMPELEYIFKHVLQEATYESILLQRGQRTACAGLAR